MFDVYSLVTLYRVAHKIGSLAVVIKSKDVTLL